MVRLNGDGRVPATAEGRLNELAAILARALRRMGTKKSGSHPRNRLELCSETRLTVTAPETNDEGEVT